MWVWLAGGVEGFWGEVTPGVSSFPPKATDLLAFSTLLFPQQSYTGPHGHLPAAKDTLKASGVRLYLPGR